MICSIWLLDTAKLFKSPLMTYHGFDISEAQFPSEFPQEVGEIAFSVHNILEPFPEAHLSRYDVVHVRLLVQALRVVDVENAVKNVAGLLRM